MPRICMYECNAVCRPFCIGCCLESLNAKKERHAQLIRLLGELLVREPEAPFTRLFLFYDRDAALPCVAEHWSEPVRAVSRCA